MNSAGLSIGDFFRTKTLWVDKNRSLVYREDSTTKMTLPNTHSHDYKTAASGTKEMDESKFMPKNGQATQNLKRWARAVDGTIRKDVRPS